MHDHLVFLFFLICPLGAVILILPASPSFFGLSPSTCGFHLQNHTKFHFTSTLLLPKIPTVQILTKHEAQISSSFKAKSKTYVISRAFKQFACHLNIPSETLPFTSENCFFALSLSLTDGWQAAEREVAGWME